MKIYPDLQKIWSQNIKEAGKTATQAKKVIRASELTQKKTANHLKNTHPSKNAISQLLKKLNAF